MKVSPLSRYVWAANAFCRNIEIFASAVSSSTTTTTTTTTTKTAAAAFLL
jgi:hypothetical protein